jgi:hypothetical protein
MQAWSDDQRNGRGNPAVSIRRSSALYAYAVHGLGTKDVHLRSRHTERAHPIASAM